MDKKRKSHNPENSYFYDDIISKYKSYNSNKSSNADFTLKNSENKLATSGKVKKTKFKISNDMLKFKKEREEYKKLKNLSTKGEDHGKYYLNTFHNTDDFKSRNNKEGIIVLRSMGDAYSNSHTSSYNFNVVKQRMSSKTIQNKKDSHKTLLNVLNTYDHTQSKSRGSKVKNSEKNCKSKKTSSTNLKNVHRKSEQIMFETNNSKTYVLNTPDSPNHKRLKNNLASNNKINVYTYNPNTIKNSSSKNHDKSEHHSEFDSEIDSPNLFDSNNRSQYDQLKAYMTEKEVIVEDDNESIKSNKISSINKAKRKDTKTYIKNKLENNTKTYKTLVDNVNFELKNHTESFFNLKKMTSTQENMNSNMILASLNNLDLKFLGKNNDKSFENINDKTSDPNITNKKKSNNNNVLLLDTNKDNNDTLKKRKSIFNFEENHSSNINSKQEGKNLLDPIKNFSIIHEQYPINKSFHHIKQDDLKNCLQNNVKSNIKTNLISNMCGSVDFKEEEIVIFKKLLSSDFNFASSFGSIPVVIMRKTEEKTVFNEKKENVNSKEDIKIKKELKGKKKKTGCCLPFYLCG